MWSTNKVCLTEWAIYAKHLIIFNFLCVFADQEEDGRKVLVLSYPQYCRYRSVLARLREQPSSLLIDHTVLALGGIAALGGSTRILYCRDTFEHPTLLQNESICDEFGEFDSWKEGRNITSSVITTPWRCNVWTVASFFLFETSK